MQKKIKMSLVVLGFIGLQCVALELFERYYYKIEENFTTHQIKQAMPEAGSTQTNALYQYDKYGFRTYNIDYENKKGYRVLLVGGNSIAMGFGVPIEQSFGFYLQKKLENLHPNKTIEVINACLPGHPLPKNMALLKDIFFDIIKPDLVLYTSYLYETDLYFSGDNTPTNLFSHKDDLFNAPQGTHPDINPFKIFRIDQTHVGKILVEHSLLAAKLISYIDLHLGKNQNKIKNKLLKNKTHRAVSGYIEDLNQYLSVHNIKFMIVELPRSKKNPLSREIRTLSAMKGIPYLSLKEQWDENSLQYIENGHYAPDTNLQVGEALADWVGNAAFNAR